MVSKGENKLVIYPEYFNINLSRTKGRRIPKNLAFERITCENIAEAAKKLNLNPIIEKKSYPRFWYNANGRVIIDKKYSKQKIIIELCKVMKHG